MNITCIIGSLREKSINRALFNTLQKSAPEGVSITETSIAALPLYNADSETPLPHAVEEFKKSIASADGVIFITPEYNRSIPGVLKNAIDWGSRPSKQSSWFGKPATVMGVTTGSLGTSAAQIHLKAILAHLGTRQMGQPEFLLGKVGDVLSEDEMSIVGDDIQVRIQNFATAFVEHIHHT